MPDDRCTYRDPGSDQRCVLRPHSGAHAIGLTAHGLALEAVRAFVARVEARHTSGWLRDAMLDELAELEANS